MDIPLPKRRADFRPDVVGSKLGNFNVLSVRQLKKGKVTKPEYLSWGENCTFSTMQINYIARTVKPVTVKSPWYYCCMDNVADMKKSRRQHIDYAWERTEYEQLLRLNYFKMERPIHDIMMWAKVHLEVHRLNLLAIKFKPGKTRAVENWAGARAASGWTVNQYMTSNSHKSVDYNNWALCYVYNRRNCIV